MYYYFEIFFIKPAFYVNSTELEPVIQIIMDYTKIQNRYRGKYPEDFYDKQKKYE